LKYDYFLALATALFVEHHTSCAIYCRQGILKISRIATTDAMLGGFESALNAGSGCVMRQFSNPTPGKITVGQTGGCHSPSYLFAFPSIHTQANMLIERGQEKLLFLGSPPFRKEKEEEQIGNLIPKKENKKKSK